MLEVVLKQSRAFARSQVAGYAPNSLWLEQRKTFSFPHNPLPSKLSRCYRKQFHVVGRGAVPTHLENITSAFPAS